VISVAFAFVIGKSLVLEAAQPLALQTSSQSQKPSALDKKDTSVEPTSWGDVTGHIYDAKTKAPIMGAVVSVETDTGFEASGQTVSKTDDLGGYRARAILGRISENFDISPAAFSSPIAILLGSGRNQTKRIDVSQATMRVSAPGCKVF
jgi:hypothetical protein